MATPVQLLWQGEDSLQDEESTCKSRFAKRRLKAWQPIFTPRRVITCYLATGAAFLGIGVVLLLVSDSVEAYVQDYTDMPTDRHGVGSFDLRIERDMEPPIWVYYQLDGFHQNHRRYVKSRSNAQLREGSGPPKILEQDLKECSPWISSGDQVNYPCGVIARTVFNDSYALLLRSGEGEKPRRLAVDSRAETIAWDSDVKGEKFSNLDPEARGNAGENQVMLNMWILQRFPPVVCEQDEISEQKPWIPVYPARRNVTLQADPASDRPERQVSVTDCSGYSDKPRCRFVRGGKPFNCSGNGFRQVRVQDWGVESGHFIAWMRIAGLPSFRKLWGRIDVPIKAGSIVTVYYASSFPVRPNHGRKAFVLSTASEFGGPNPLGFGYLAVGGCCLAMGIAFMWQRIARPRLLGDVSLLCPSNLKYSMH